MWNESSPRRRPRPVAAVVAAATALALATAARGEGDATAALPDALPADAHVVRAKDVQLDEEMILEVRLASLDRGATYRYVAVLLDAPRAPLLEVARGLRERWRLDGYDQRHGVVLVVVATRPTETAVVLPPPGACDRLGLSARRLAQLVADDFAPADGLARAVAKLAQSTNDRLGRLETERDQELARRIAGQSQLGAQVLADLAAVSSRLTTLEQRGLALGASGLDAEAEEQALVDVRRRLTELHLDLGDAARLGEGRAMVPLELVAPPVREMNDALVKIERALNDLQARRLDAAQALARTTTALDAISEAVRSRGELAPPAARVACEAAAEAVAEAGKQLDAGRPALAERQLALAEEDLAQARRALSPPPGPPRDPLPWLVFGGLTVGLGLLALGGVALGASAMRAATASRLAALRTDLGRLATDLERELLSLRTLHLQASRPAPVTVPDALGPAGPLPRAFGGETAEHLARARGRIDDLQRSWRKLSHALARGDALAAVPGAEADALDALERAALNRLPVSEVRETAQTLARIQRAPESCAARLVEIAAALTRAEALAEEVLAAGQSAQPFEDDLADLAERAHDAAREAQRDPIGAALLAADGLAVLTRIEDRVHRTVELARGVRALRGRLGALPPPRASLGGDDVPALVTWAHDLGDEVSQALDEGARDEATRELDRAASAARDCELVVKGASARPEAELQSLREELHLASGALSELTREFERPAWEDVEVGLVRAAARLELLADRVGRGERVPRLAARLHGVRAACLQVTSRLLQLRGERERALALLEVLEGRINAVRGYVSREHAGVSPGVAKRLDEVVARLGRLATRARAEGRPPAWAALLGDIGQVEQALDRVRELAGDAALRHRRAMYARNGLEKALREAEDVMRRANPDSVGARACLARARASLAEADEGLRASMPEAPPAPAPGTPASPPAPRGPDDWRLAIGRYQAGLAACREAREMAAPRVLREKLEAGALGDARFSLVLARQAWGKVHRAWVLGLTGEPTEVRARLAEAEQSIALDPTRALELAIAAITLAESTTAAALLKDEQAADALRDERLADLAGADRERQAWEQALRRGERARRTRFEVLVLGEEPDDATDGEDIDAGDAADELDALDEATADAPGASEGETADADADAGPDAPATDVASAPTVDAPPPGPAPGAIELAPATAPDPDAAVGPSPVFPPDTAAADVAAPALAPAVAAPADPLPPADPAPPPEATAAPEATAVPEAPADVAPAPDAASAGDAASGDGAVATATSATVAADVAETAPDDRGA